MIKTLRIHKYHLLNKSHAVGDSLLQGKHYYAFVENDKLIPVKQLHDVTEVSTHFT